MTEDDKRFMQRAIELSNIAVETNMGGPFGCVVVKDGKIIAEGHNSVTGTNDPTAHAEMVAIRNACKELNSFQLDDCVIYTSCEPCPMCFGAIYWSRAKKVYYGCTKEDAAKIDFDDQFIYDELDKKGKNQKIEFVNMMRSDSNVVFDQWAEKNDKVKY